VRLTTVDEQVSEGIFIEMDEYAITLADTTGDVNLVTVPTDAVDRFEIYYGGVSGRTLGKVAVVAVSSAIIFAIIDSESGPVFSPDGATTAKVFCVERRKSNGLTASR
jgi:hypothetical protein